MNKLVYLKVLVLVVALGGIVYVITHLNAGKMQAGLDQMGLSQPGTTAAAPVAEGEEVKINLCPNRVHAIVWPDGRKIQETTTGLKRKWQAYNLDPVDMGYMDMEKWLSLHCEIQASPLKTADVAFGPLLTIEYIDGSREAMQRSPEGLYRFTATTFDSPDLTQALEDLVVIANLKPLGP